ncbi:MAG: sigma-70 family RNA polymerase sigma factor [Myxococcaceae bacterium]|nr:sigma-70 family RNA polymerase sigma factor [Myxococcaceae bacterium]
MPLLEDSTVLLEKYGPYVRSLASQVRKQFSASVELEDLLSYGQVGLLEAAERFDPRVGANFLTFAHYRIKGAIFDGLRKMGVLRGGDARAAYISERANAYLGNLSDRDSGASNRGGSIADDVNELSSAVTGLAMVFAASLEGTEGLQLSDEQMPADERLELEQLKKRVRAAIARLPEKERRLLEGYYFQGKTLEEAGAEIGQSKSWASRLHARAVETLRQMLSEEEDTYGSSNGGRERGADRAAEAAGPRGATAR